MQTHRMCIRSLVFAGFFSSLYSNVNGDSAAALQYTNHSQSRLSVCVRVCVLYTLAGVNL